MLPIVTLMWGEPDAEARSESKSFLDPSVVSSSIQMLPFSVPVEMFDAAPNVAVEAEVAMMRPGGIMGEDQKQKSRRRTFFNAISQWCIQFVVACLTAALLLQQAAAIQS